MCAFFCANDSEFYSSEMEKSLSVKFVYCTLLKINEIPYRTFKLPFYFSLCNISWFFAKYIKLKPMVMTYLSHSGNFMNDKLLPSYEYLHALKAAAREFDEMRIHILVWGIIS